MTTPLTFRLRMVIGVLALLGLLVAVYLSVFELACLMNPDFCGDPVCPTAGCGEVNRSRYVTMLGIPIAVLGAMGCTLILAVDLGWMTRCRMALSPGERRGRPGGSGPGKTLRRWLATIPVGLVLIGLSGFGFLFTLFLKYLELFKIQAICFWCLVSALLMTAIFALSLAAWRAERVPAVHEPVRGRRT